MFSNPCRRNWNTRPNLYDDRLLLGASEDLSMAEAHEWKYIDPMRTDPSRKGMLLSNEIEMFRKKNLLISEGFKPENLRPAAYTLRIGPKFVDSKGRVGQLDATKENYFKMEPNSIVYVSTLEKLDLPHYIAARFNLRVKWVYRGILLGTGPQVEPGYRGYLSCPLYNLTDRPIKIEYAQDFATIDFERTTNFCPGASAQQILAAKISGDEFDRVGHGGEEYLLFKKEYPPLKLLPDHDVVSSLFELSQEVRTWRNIGIGFAVSFFALTLTLLSFGSNAYRQVSDLGKQVGDLSSNLRDDHKDLATTQEDLKTTKDKLIAMEKAIQALETKLNALTRKKP
jgi:deoxycytidine triphosphate deaminase